MGRDKICRTPRTPVPPFEFDAAVACLTHWLTRSGFDVIRYVDVSRTTAKERARPTGSTRKA